jgi:anti-sigma regulatory factor (Ser/Thr protein kinase)
MDNPAGGCQRRPGPRPRGAILGTLTVPGEPEQVSHARGFVVRVLEAAGLPGVDSDAATLLTSELVTNAIVHTGSGRPGGTVTVIVTGLPDGVLVEVVDNGSAGVPVVKGRVLAGDGQGLFLVQQMATQWGYLRDQASMTVWFYLAGERAGQRPSVSTGRPRARQRRSPPGHRRW